MPVFLNFTFYPRASARAEIDAACAVLMGFDRADLAHAVSTFEALRARELKTYGSFVTARRLLGAYDALVG